MAYGWLAGEEAATIRDRTHFIWPPEQHYQLSSAVGIGHFLLIRNKSSGFHPMLGLYSTLELGSLDEVSEFGFEARKLYTI
jgi:hypothetical protein